MIPKRQYRVLTEEEAALLRRRGLTGHDAAKQGLLMPVAGGSPGDDDDDDNDDDDSDDDDSDDDDDDNDDKSKKNKKNEDDDDDDDYERIPRSEAQRMRRELAEAQKEERKRKRQEKKDAERRKADQGKFEEIANDAKKERDEAIADKEKAERELETYKENATITTVAQRLLFRDPADAHKYLSDEDRKKDEAGIERALKNVLKDKGYLKHDKPPTGGGHQQNGKNGKGLTLEDIQAMSQEEIQKRQKEVDEAMARIGQEG